MDRLTSVERVVELVQRAELKRDQVIIDTAIEATAPDGKIEAAVDWPALVGAEAAKLYNRMRFLVENPKVSSFAGGSAIKLSLLDREDRRPFYTTGPLLAIDPELIDKASVQSYFEISTEIEPKQLTPSWTEDQPITIEHVLCERETGEVNKKTIYEIDVLTDRGVAIDLIPAVPRGRSFMEFASSYPANQIEEFKQQNPWAKDVKITKKEDEWRAKGSAVIEDQPAIWGLLRLLDASSEDISYPEELYHYPLGLLIQANRILGPKKRYGW